MKGLGKFIILIFIALLTAGIYACWRTSVSFKVQAPYDLGPSFTFQADNFLIEIPDSYHLTMLTGLLEWPDGFRMDFQEYLSSEAGNIQDRHAVFTETELARGAERLDLSRELGRPSILAVYPPEQRGDRPEMSLLVKFHNGLAILNVYPAEDGAAADPAEETNPASERKRLMLLSAKEFLDAYYWIGAHPGRPEPGVFRTRLGLISKRGQEIFRYRPLQAKFWSSDFGQSFDLESRRSGAEVTDHCSLGRLERFQKQWSGRGGRRSNCLDLSAGGRRGQELLTLNGSNFEEASYRLIWEPDHEGLRDGEFRLLFYMSSPLRSLEKDKTPESPDSVIGRWRAMLETVRFF